MACIPHSSHVPTSISQRTLYRQFLRRANGSVIEMFGSSELSLAAVDSYKELDTMLREAAQQGGEADR